jgi:hypothetical protein
MHPSEKQALNHQINELIKEIDRSIDAVKLKAQEQGFDATQMMYADGKFVMVPLLVAKAEALSAKVRLNVKE